LEINCKKSSNNPIKTKIFLKIIGSKEKEQKAKIERFINM